MRRQLLVGLAVGGGLVIGISLVVWAGTQGWLGPNGKPKRLLIAADRAVTHGQFGEAQGDLEELLATFPDSPLADEALFQLGQVHQQQDQPVEARAAYRLLLERFPSSPLATQTQERLGTVNVTVFFSPVVTEADAAYEVKAGDTLGAIATHHHVTLELLKRANGLTNDLIRPRQKLKIPRGAFTILVDKSQNQLLVTQDNQFFKSYAVATGTDGSTPTGTFKIVNKLVNPVWYRQGAVVPPESPENILGTRWLGFDKKGYGIHGSVDPSGIGKQVTAGCVRMHNQDVEELFALIPLGTDVTIVD
ncbi:MAG: L,D-transpeptidase family protein [Candidatus Omnitrophica bacterium]|nr:L,D-transpeptidase family protein [Candidatus Omnitrophota bacterium]